MRLSPELRWRLYYKVDVAGSMLGWSRAESYRAVRRGHLPVEKDGKFLLVPKRQWDLKVRRVREKLRVVEAAAAKAAAEAAPEATT